MLSSLKCPYRLWGSPSLVFNVWRGLLPRCKRPRTKPDPSLLSRGWVKTVCSQTSTSPNAFNGTQWVNFTFLNLRNAWLWRLMATVCDDTNLWIFRETVSFIQVKRKAERTSLCYMGLEKETERTEKNPFKKKWVNLLTYYYPWRISSSRSYLPLSFWSRLLCLAPICSPSDPYRIFLPYPNANSPSKAYWYSPKNEVAF